MVERKWFIRGMMVVALATALAACGGGGSATTGTGGSNVTLQGVVPGTVFIAVDNETNTEVERATATGTPKTFSMILPTGKTYRFYLMENESAGSGARIYPYYSGSTNVFEMTDNTAGMMIDLGTVAPNMTTGNASSTIDPMSHAGILGQGTNGMMPPSLANAMFSADNLAGTWHFNTLATSGTMGWTHGSLVIDHSGIGNMTGLVQNGNPVPGIGNIPYTMSEGGMVHAVNDNTFRGVMSKDASLMVATFTDNAGGYDMMMAQKRGGSYTMPDLDGTWHFQRMTAGTDNLTSGWAYGTMTMSGGFGTITAITTNNGGTGEAGRTFLFAMGGDGIMTAAGNASFNGAMSINKDMIVATDNTGSGSNLWILMKSGGTYSLPDLAGDWMMNGVISGNSGSRDWTVGHSVIGSGGQMAFSQMMGHGGTMSVPESTLDIDPTGAISISGTGMGGGMMGSMMAQTFHGTMNTSKGLMVSTYSDGTGGYRFAIQMK